MENQAPFSAGHGVFSGKTFTTAITSGRECSGLQTKVEADAITKLFGR
jgi:hypothetical protein